MQTDKTIFYRIFAIELLFLVSVSYQVLIGRLEPDILLYSAFCTVAWGLPVYYYVRGEELFGPIDEEYAYGYLKGFAICSITFLSTIFIIRAMPLEIVPIREVSNLLYVVAKAYLESLVFTVFFLTVWLDNDDSWFSIIIASLVSALIIGSLHWFSWGGLKGVVKVSIAFFVLNLNYAVGKYKMNLPMDGVVCDVHAIYNILMLHLIMG